MWNGRKVRACVPVNMWTWTLSNTVKGKNYYVVYAWGDYDGIYSELDLRGH